MEHQGRKQGFEEEERDLASSHPTWSGGRLLVKQQVNTNLSAKVIQERVAQILLCTFTFNINRQDVLEWGWHTETHGSVHWSDAVPHSQEGGSVSTVGLQ